jgi:hypothetical protein
MALMGKIVFTRSRKWIEFTSKSSDVQESELSHYRVLKSMIKVSMGRLLLDNNFVISPFRGFILMGDNLIIKYFVQLIIVDYIH